LVTVKPGAKRFLLLAGGVFLLFLVVTQPQQSAGIVRDLLAMLRGGAESLATFIRSLFA
jgi:hypothetical protein